MALRDLDYIINFQGDTRPLQNINRAGNDIDSNMRTLNNRFAQVGQSFSNIGKKFSNAGSFLTKSVTLPLMGIGAAIIKASTDYESAFAGVKKTVDGTEEQLKRIDKGIRDMTKTMPQSAVEIAGVSEAAGQLGIETESILGFTKTMVMLGDSTNMTSEQAATDLARLANITQMPQTQFDRLGSTVVALGNNLATTESEIVSMGLRLAGAGKQIGLSEAQILSFAGALSSVGIEAEAGGSAFSKVMIDMQLAVETGNESLNDFAKVAGMSAEQFQTAFKEDATGALISFIGGLSKAKDNGESAIKVLDEMGITEVRMRDALLRASGAGDLFSNSLKIGTEAWKENVALANEANQRYETTESKIAMAKNQIMESARVIGANLLPVVRDIASKIAVLSEKFANLSPAMQQSIIKFGGLAIAAGPFLKLMGGGIGLVGKFATALGGVGTVAGTASTATAAAGAATGGLGLAAKAGALLLNPWVLGIAAAGAAGYGLYKTLKKDVVPAVDLFADGVSHSKKQMNEFGEAFGGMEKTTVKISEATKTAVQSYIDMDKEVSDSMMNMYIKQEKLTDEHSQNMLSKINNMTKQITEGYTKHQQEEIADLQEFFSNSKNISDFEQAEILKKTNDFYNNKKESTQYYENEITKIIQEATNNNRELTEAELTRINGLQEEMRVNAINALSETEAESKVILQRIKDFNKNMTAEQAAEQIKALNDTRDKAVATAQDDYEKRIALIERLKSEGKLKSQEQADMMIQEAQRQKEETVSRAERMRLEVLTQIRGLYDDLDKEINTREGRKMRIGERIFGTFKPEASAYSYTSTARPEQASSAVPNFASGGSLRKGQLFQVNENGGELQIADNDRTIIPHDLSKRYMRDTFSGGSGDNIAFNPNITIYVQQASSNIDIEEAVKKGIEDSYNTLLVKMGLIPV